MGGIRNLREFVTLLRDDRELVEVSVPVDPSLEIAEIHRRVVAAGGPALLFTNVKGSKFPVATNLFGSNKRVERAFPNRPEKLVRELVELATREFPPSLGQLWKKRRTLSSLLKIGLSRKRRAPVMEQRIDPVDLEQLPLLKSWPLDGGHFITLPLVYTEPVEGGGPGNLGMYRVQRYDKNSAGLHFQIGKGGGYHHYVAEQRNEPLPVTIFIGGPPALMLSAIAPLPENVPELLLASLLQGGTLATAEDRGHSHRLIAEAEFALIGSAPPKERRDEGPFGDHYGYYSWKHPFPYFRCRTLYHRKNAIYPATVVGKPRQEDFYIGDYLQELLSPLFPVVMPGIKALWSYGETGFHSLGAAVVRERFYRECMASAFRILGEGQLALTKFLLLTDQPVDVRNFPEVLQAVLERFQPETDLFVFSNLSLDTLDYTGPELNKGSRGVLLGVGDKQRDLPSEFVGKLPSKVQAAVPLCPGCLVIEGESWKEGERLERICRAKAFQEWPLLVLVDDVTKATRDIPSFLWTTFTRFEPAADLYCGKSDIQRHHICYQGPILIDARMKPSYPQELIPDNETEHLVTQRWKEYFPQGMEMGDSAAAHVV